MTRTRSDRHRSTVYASLWLLPASVAAYTLRGGLRATLLTDWVHTVVIFIFVLIFYFKVSFSFRPSQFTGC